MPSVTVNTDEFCSEVGALANLPSQLILEIAGGLANLYLEEAVRRGGVVEVETEGFASSYVSRETILQEIKNCSGADSRQSEVILVAMQKVLKKMFERYCVTDLEKTIFLPFIGEIKSIDSQTDHYKLTCRDAAADYYKDFLL